MTIYFRLFGALTLLLNPAMFPEVFDSTSTRPQFLRALVLMLAVEMVGFGLAFLRKWAALYFSLTLFYVGIRLAVFSLYSIAFPLNFDLIVCAIFLTLPLRMTIRNWKSLTWGRWFF